MRITIPTLSGISNPFPGLREVIRSIEEIATGLQDMTSRGIIPQANISHEVVVLRGEGYGWITVPHSLRREPLGYLLRSGTPSVILDSRLSRDTVQVLLKEAATVSIVVM